MIDLSQFTTEAKNVIGAVKKLSKMDLPGAWASLEGAFGNPEKAATDGTDAAVMTDVGEVLEQIAPFIPVASAPIAIAGDALELGALVEPDIAAGAATLLAFKGGKIPEVTIATEQNIEDRFGTTHGRDDKG